LGSCSCGDFADVITADSSTSGYRDKSGKVYETLQNNSLPRADNVNPMLLKLFLPNIMAANFKVTGKPW
jgi:hypothetical protein